MRLLTLHLVEPLPGRVLPLVAESHGPEEAARRYRAITTTTLRQLRGLGNARLRVLTDPPDAEEALRFWLLPLLADRWQAAGEGVFRADGWEIDFGGSVDGFTVEAWGEILCPFLSARWVHAAMLGLERGAHQVSGPAAGGGECFRARGRTAEQTTALVTLPELPVIHTDRQWREGLDSALGPALKRAWEEAGRG